MPEGGLSAEEAAKELAEHAKHARGHGHEEHHHDRLITIAEAAMLAVVTLVAAWSGYSAAKWGTESSLHLAKASATRTKSTKAYQQSLTYRVGDGLLMNAWFAAHASGNLNEQRVMEKRFTPELKVAFDAWIKTNPFTNPNAPPGPQSMPQYHAPGAAESVAFDAEADHQYADGQHAGHTADDYIRVTVILASVLFLVGISTHFRLRGVRMALIGVGAILLVLAAVQLLLLPLA
ncbi:MAG TPA: hypothetical protein VHS03_12120 [Gaiellaceae bacterium]|nr:hypothetical protein [Gaiellaceae bacterium]